MILVWLSFRYENKALFAIRFCGIMYTTVEDCNALIHFLFLSIYNLFSTLQVYNLFLKDSISRIFGLCSKTFTTYNTILCMAIYTSSVREKLVFNVLFNVQGSIRFNVHFKSWQQLQNHKREAGWTLAGVKVPPDLQKFNALFMMPMLP